jgi:hypothetical protein
VWPVRNRPAKRAGNDGGAERLSSGSVHPPTLPRAAVASHTAVDLGRGRSGTRPGAGFPGSPPTIALRSTTDRDSYFQGGGRLATRRRSQWFSHRSCTISRDSTGVLMPIGGADSLSRRQSSQTTIQRRSDRCTILGWWTFRTARLLANRIRPYSRPRDGCQAVADLQLGRDDSVNHPWRAIRPGARSVTVDQRTS